MLIDNVCIGAQVDNRQKLNFKNKLMVKNDTGKDSNRFIITSDVLAILFHFCCATEKQPSLVLSSLWGGRDSYDRQ